MIFREDISGDRLLESSERNEKNIALIFDDDTDEEEKIDQNVQNIETSISEQRIIELMKNELINPINEEENHENRENQMIPINQKARNSKKSGNFNQSTRRSARVIKSYNPYEFNNQKGLIAMSAFDSTQKFEPTTYEEATNCPDQRLWKIAITEQLNALIINQTWELADRPSNNENVITFKWVFKMKYTQIGHIDRYKTRLIVKGFTQVQGVDFEKIFSSTLRLESFRMLLAFSAHFDYEIEQMNVFDAYLKGDLKKTIYIKIPKGYTLSGDQSVSQSEGKVLKLLRSLYELKQSGRE